MKFITKEPIDKGWSGDRKYCVTDSEGKKYLLRISDISKKESKEAYFNVMKLVASLDIPMCLPIEFGVCDEGVYSVQSWIEGYDAEDAMIALDDDRRYEYGVESGKFLRKIHSLPAPANAENWELRFNRKIERKIKLYNECPLKYERGEFLLEYVNKNRHLLKDRPQARQHGDYHIGNMMIDNDGRLCIIDFDRADFGDPWEEFNRIVWCAQKAPSFATGMVDGYFDGNVPADFWDLLALYISTNTLSSLPWAVPFGEGEIQTMCKQAGEILSWYDNMNNTIPSWYDFKRQR